MLRVVILLKKMTVTRKSESYFEALHLMELQININKVKYGDNRHFENSQALFHEKGYRFNVKLI